MDELLSFKRAFHEFAACQHGADPGPLAATWMKVALSSAALLRLSPDSEQFDAVLRGGIAAAVGRLGDPKDPATRGHISSWLFGAAERVPDVMLIIAADRKATLPTA